MDTGPGRKPVSSHIQKNQSAAVIAARSPWSVRLIALLAASITLLLALEGLAAWNFRTQDIEGGWVAHTNQVRFELLRILQLLTDAQSGARGYAYAGSNAALEAYRDAAPQISPSIDHLLQLVSDNPNQRSLAAELQRMASDLQAWNETLLNNARTGNTAQVQALIRAGTLIEAMAGARKLIGGMQAEEDRLLIERRLARDRARRAAHLALWGTGGFGVVLLVLLVYFTRRDEESLHLAERELATMLRSIGDAVIATDVNGAIRFMNPVAAQLTGWNQNEARGRPLSDVFRIIDEDTRDPVVSPVAQVVQEGRRVQLANQTLLLTRDGILERAIANSWAPVLGPSGEVQGMVLVFRDVSEERDAKRALQLREAELQIINTYARFPVARCDPEHRYLFVNRAYAERLGLKPEDCVGRHIREVAGELAYESIRHYMDAALAGQSVEFETEIPYSGSYGRRWMHCIYAPVYDSDGTVESFVAAVTDVTERKNAEEELRRSKAALMEADRRKDEFIAMLSHELRNPLAPIRAAAEIIASPRVAPAQSRRAQVIIARQVTHMALLLDDLLDIARITQGKLHLKKGPVMLADVVDAALEAARPMLNGKNHQLSLALPAEPVFLDADSLRLSQILSNLLLNAAKYCDPGSRIDLVGTVQGGTLLLSVKDDGIGMAPESINGIFEMFSQIEGMEGRSEGGLGIGLALVKGLTELHGGTVEARSEGLGCGSEFIVRLPIAAADTAAGPRATARALPPQPPGAAARRRILIADDNRDAAESLSVLLQLAGHEVRVAHRGQAALSLVQAFRPDTALLDIGMPDLSGYQVAQALRQQPWASRIQLIALTGWGQEEDRRRALEAGFDHHMTKPIDPDQLQRFLGGYSDERAPDQGI